MFNPFDWLRPKRLLLLLMMLTQGLAKGQDFSFIPDSLHPVPLAELLSKPRPSEVPHVYFDDGTKTTLQEVRPLMFKKFTPRMYADKNGNYVALVAEEIKIRFDGIPEHLEKMGYSMGNPESDVVIVFVQGGPHYSLNLKDFDNVFNVVGKVDMNKHFLVTVHQVQTMNPEKFQTEEITFDQAKEYARESIGMLYDIVSYFKEQNKKVYLVGKSHGSFTSEFFLSEYGNLAEGYLFMVGRLDIEDEIWRAYSQGIGYRWSEDGTQFLIDEKITDDIIVVNRRKIAASFGFNRFTDLLKDKDLTNVIYQYGELDRNCGPLTTDEVEFLKSKGASVIPFEGDHYGWSGTFPKAFALLLEK